MFAVLSMEFPKLPQFVQAYDSCYQPDHKLHLPAHEHLLNLASSVWSPSYHTPGRCYHCPENT